MQQAFRSPIRFRLVQHPGEAERDFEKRPAIHPLKIHRRRLDSVIDLERVMLVACPNQGQADGGGPLADRQRLPILGFGLRDQAIELVLSLENGAKRQARFDREGARANQKDRNQNLPALHMANNSTRNSSPINPESIRSGYNGRRRQLSVGFGHDDFHFYFLERELIVYHAK